MTSTSTNGFRTIKDYTAVCPACGKPGTDADPVRGGAQRYHRACAAELYAAKRLEMIDDLADAIGDPDEVVAAELPALAAALAQLQAALAARIAAEAAR
jgi:hypothetical protein